MFITDIRSSIDLQKLVNKPEYNTYRNWLQVTKVFIAQCHTMRRLLDDCLDVDVTDSKNKISE